MGIDETEEGHGQCEKECWGTHGGNGRFCRADRGNETLTLVDKSGSRISISANTIGNLVGLVLSLIQN